jgi:hypothetical protein
MAPSQVKMALQAGATYMRDAGLMGAGAGSVNFMASRKLTTTLLGLLPTNLIGGLLSPASGAMFWDTGTLATRLYAGVGIRLLSILQGPLVWLNSTLLNTGDLNLLGLDNPLASIAAKSLLYGQVADWTTGQTIMWGTSYTTEGTTIMWGTSTTAEDPK